MTARLHGWQDKSALLPPPPQGGGGDAVCRGVAGRGPSLVEESSAFDDGSYRTERVNTEQRRNITVYLE